MTWTVTIEEDSHVDSVASDGKPVRTYSRKYGFATDSGSYIYSHEARAAFETETGISKGTTFHPDNDGAICMNMKVAKKPTKPPHQRFDVDVDWTTDWPEIDEEDPSLRRWMRTVQTSEQQRHIFKDRDGNMIVDSAGSPFDGGVPVNVRLATITWTHNVDWALYDLARPTQLSGRVNSDSFLGCDAGTLMLDVKAEESLEGGGKYHFVKETITITYDPLGWQPKPANAGLFEVIGGEQFRCIDDNGVECTEPQPLYESGEMIPIANRPNDCNFVDVDYYFATAFADLGLPLT